MPQTADPIDSAVRSHYPTTHALKRDAEDRAAYYETLMQVNFRHPYYNRNDDACPDLAARPTAAAQQAMSALGLLFRDDGTSFSVLYNRTRSDALASWLARQGRGGQFWTRLTFVLTSRSPYFINVTDLPIDLDPLRENLYLANQAAHDDPEVGVLLNPGRIVSAEQLIPVTGSQYQARVSADVRGIAVRAISGEVVLCEPRCVPKNQSAPPAVCLGWLAGLPATTPDRCRDTIYLNFGMLPEDKYTIDTIADSGDVIRQEVRLYTADAPTPLGLIDLLFSEPFAGAGGIYPVSDPAGDDVTISGVDYVLNFGARSTFWRYHIVPPAPDTAYDDLAIECLAPDPALSFAGPVPVILANGAPAYLFVSEQPLLLQQQSIYRFRLKGRLRHRRLEEDTLVDRLPVAAPQQILPQTDDAGAARNYSDIYVYV